MNEISAKLEKQLAPLLEALEDTRKLYTTAAGNALNDRLRQLFEARAEQRQAFATSLRQRSWVDKDASVDADAPLDVLKRGSMTIKATMTIEPHKTDLVLIRETREADSDLLEEYRTVRKEDLAPGLDAILRRQQTLVEAARANLATMMGAPDKQMALGLFPTVQQAQEAVGHLQDNGFDSQNIDVLAQEEAVKSLIEDPRPETTKESATAGAVGGGALGGLVGLIAGASTVAVMGMGTILTGGALAAVLGITAAGAGIGASYGGLLGALMGWGISEGDVQHFIEGVRDGSILVAVETEHARSKDAIKIMRDAGATYASAHQEEEAVEEVDAGD